MSSVLILSQPIAKAFSFPSAMIATIVSAGKSTSILAPLDVKPGHMIFAPDKTNLMAPRSTWIFGSKSGSKKIPWPESNQFLVTHTVNWEEPYICVKVLKSGRRGRQSAGRTRSHRSTTKTSSGHG